MDHNIPDTQPLPLKLNDVLPINFFMFSEIVERNDEKHYMKIVVSNSFYSTDIYILDSIFKPISNIL